MNYIAVPQWYGACKKGTEAGALRLAEIFKEEGIGEYSKIYVSDGGIGDDTLMPYFPVIDDVNRTLCEAVYSALSAGIKVITLGGDHSVSWGLLLELWNLIQKSVSFILTPTATATLLSVRRATIFMECTWRI